MTATTEPGRWIVVNHVPRWVLEGRHVKSSPGQMSLWDESAHPREQAGSVAPGHKPGEFAKKGEGHGTGSTSGHSLHDVPSLPVQKPDQPSGDVRPAQQQPADAGKALAEKADARVGQDVPGLVPTQGTETAIEAAERAKSRGVAKDVFYGKIHPEAARQITTLLADLTDQYGRALSGVRAVPADKFQIAFGAGTEADVPMGVRNAGGMNVLVLNEDALKDPQALKRFSNRISKYHIASGANLAGYIAHEFGHALAMKSGLDLGAIFDRYLKEDHSISGRSRHDEEEMAAEAFAYLRSGGELKGALAELLPAFRKTEVNPEPPQEAHSKPKSSWTPVTLENGRKAWKAPNGVVWTHALHDGEISPVTGEPKRKGQWMPIHGLSQKQPKRPKSEKPSQPAPVVKPNENAKDRPARPPMTPEQIEEERQRREQQSKWDQINAGPLGRMKWLGERPNREALQREVVGLKEWTEYAKDLGPAGMKRLVGVLEPMVHRTIEDSVNAAAADPVHQANAAAGFSRKFDPQEQIDWEKSEIRRRSNDDIDIGRGKKHNKEVPDSFYARQLLQEAIRQDASVDGFHRLNSILADAAKTPGADHGLKVGDKIHIPAFGNRYAMDFEVKGLKGGKAMIGYPDRDHVAVTIPEESLKQFVNDLQGRVDVPANHANPSINAVASGKATLLGKGDDGLAFDTHDGNVVKVSTTVPYVPTNPGHQTPAEAADRLGLQVYNNNAMRAAGIPGILPMEFHQHGDKGFAVMKRLTIPEKLTADQLAQVSETVKQAHEKGWVIGDQIQPGVDEHGKMFIFDTGKAKHYSDQDKQETKWAKEDDIDHLRRLHEEHGVEFPDDKRKALKSFDQQVERAFLAVKEGKIDAKKAKFELHRLETQRKHALGVLKDPDDFPVLEYEGTKELLEEYIAKQEKEAGKAAESWVYRNGSPRWVAESFDPEKHPRGAHGLWAKKGSSTHAEIPSTAKGGLRARLMDAFARHLHDTQGPAPKPEPSPERATIQQLGTEASQLYLNYQTEGFVHDLAHNMADRVAGIKTMQDARNKAAVEASVLRGDRRNIRAMLRDEIADRISGDHQDIAHEFCKEYGSAPEGATAIHEAVGIVLSAMDHEMDAVPGARVRLGIQAATAEVFGHNGEEPQPGPHAALLREIVRAVHQNTQERLKRAHVDGMLLYRAVDLTDQPDRFDGLWAVGTDRTGHGTTRIVDDAAIKSAPLSAWSESYDEAYNHVWDKGRSAIVGAWVPREQIVSTPISGFGRPMWREVYVAGALEGPTRVAVTNAPMRESAMYATKGAFWRHAEPDLPRRVGESLATRRRVVLKLNGRGASENWLGESARWGYRNGSPRFALESFDPEKHQHGEHGHWAKKVASPQRPESDVPHPHDTPEFRAKVHRTEDELREHKDHERCIAWGPGGEECYLKIGVSGGVPVPKDDWPKLLGSTYSHNHHSGWDHPEEHPRSQGASFSSQDIGLALGTGMREMRAVSRGYRHSLMVPADFSRGAIAEYRKTATPEQIKAVDSELAAGETVGVIAWRYIVIPRLRVVRENCVQEGYGGLPERSHPDAEKLRMAMETNLPHVIAQRLASEFGWSYTREEYRKWTSTTRNSEEALCTWTGSLSIRSSAQPAPSAGTSDRDGRNAPATPSQMVSRTKFGMAATIIRNLAMATTASCLSSGWYVLNGSPRYVLEAGGRQMHLWGPEDEEKHPRDHGKWAHREVATQTNVRGSGDLPAAGAPMPGPARAPIQEPAKPESRGWEPKEATAEKIGDATQQGARRRRPGGLVQFEKPIVGPSGAALHSYEWQWMWEDANEEHEDEKRVSNWQQSEVNQHTGREIVHHFHLSEPGKSGTETVSLETALKKMGFGDNKEGIGKVKNLALASMQLAEHRQAHERLLADEADQKKFGHDYRVRASADRMESLVARVKNLEKQAQLAAGGKKPDDHYRHVADRAEELRVMFEQMPGYTDRNSDRTRFEGIAKTNTDDPGEQRHLQEEAVKVYHKLMRSVNRDVYGGQTGKTPQSDWSPAKRKNWFFDRGHDAEEAIAEAEKWLAQHHPNHPEHPAHKPLMDLHRDVRHGADANDANAKYNQTRRVLPHSYLAEGPDGRVVRVDGTEQADVDYFQSRGYRPISDPVARPSDDDRSNVGQHHFQYIGNNWNRLPPGIQAQYPKLDPKKSSESSVWFYRNGCPRYVLEARHLKSSAGQMSLWGDEQEREHPRGQAHSGHGGQFVKKGEGQGTAAPTPSPKPETPKVEPKPSERTQESKREPEPGHHDNAHAVLARIQASPQFNGRDVDWDKYAERWGVKGNFLEGHVPAEAILRLAENNRLGYSAQLNQDDIAAKVADPSKRGPVVISKPDNERTALMVLDGTHSLAAWSKSYQAASPKQRRAMTIPVVMSEDAAKWAGLNPEPNQPAPSAPGAEKGRGPGQPEPRHPGETAKPKDPRWLETIAEYGPVVKDAYDFLPDAAKLVEPPPVRDRQGGAAYQFHAIYLDHRDVPRRIQNDFTHEYAHHYARLTQFHLSHEFQEAMKASVERAKGVDLGDLVADNRSAGNAIAWENADKFLRALKGDQWGYDRDYMAREGNQSHEVFATAFQNHVAMNPRIWRKFPEMRDLMERKFSFDEPKVTPRAAESWIMRNGAPRWVLESWVIERRLKSAPGQRTFAWDESKVNRDARGEFAAKGAGHAEPQAEPSTQPTGEHSDDQGRTGGNEPARPEDRGVPEVQGAADGREGSAGSGDHAGERPSRRWKASVGDQWPEEYARHLDALVEQLPENTQQWIGANQAVFRYTTNDEIETMPPHMRGAFANAAALTWNNNRIHFIDGKEPDLRTLRHEMVHLAYRSIPDAALTDATEEAIKDGRKIVAFIRKKDHPDLSEQGVYPDAWKLLRKSVNLMGKSKDQTFSIELGLMMPDPYLPRIAKHLGLPVQDSQYVTLAVHLAMAEMAGRLADVPVAYRAEEPAAYRAGADAAFANSLFRFYYEPPKGKDAGYRPVLVKRQYGERWEIEDKNGRSAPWHKMPVEYQKIHSEDWEEAKRIADKANETFYTPSPSGEGKKTAESAAEPVGGASTGQGRTCADPGLTTGHRRKMGCESRPGLHAVGDAMAYWKVINGTPRMVYEAWEPEKHPHGEHGWWAKKGEQSHGLKCDAAHPHDTPEFRAELHAHEDRLREIQDHEESDIFGPDGELSAHHVGGFGELDVPKEDWPKLSGAVFTHNHHVKEQFGQDDPRAKGVSFSQFDIRMVLLHGIKEMRAVSPGYRHSLIIPLDFVGAHSTGQEGKSRLDRGWHVWNEVVDPQYDAITRRVQGEWFDRYNSAKTQAEADSILRQALADEQHNITEQLKDEFGWSYTREEHPLWQRKLSIESSRHSLVWSARPASTYETRDGGGSARRFQTEFQMTSGAEITSTRPPIQEITGSHSSPGWFCRNGSPRYVAESFDPSKHPRGHEGNVGQFASGGGSKSASIRAGAIPEKTTEKPSVDDWNAKFAELAKATGEDRWDILGRIEKLGGDRTSQMAWMDEQIHQTTWNEHQRHADKFLETWESGLAKHLTNGSITQQQAKEYRGAAAFVLTVMPTKCVERLAKNVAAVNFYGDTRQLTQFFADLDATAEAIAASGRTLGGCCEPIANGRHRLHLDGGDARHKAREFYSHEMAHAIDMAPIRHEEINGKTYRSGGGYISDTPEWTAAWKDEVDKEHAPLSAYARTDSCEGFAEFGRLLWSGRRLNEIRAAFPKCWAVWEQHGLVDKLPSRAAECWTVRNGSPRFMVMETTDAKGNEHKGKGEGGGQFTGHGG